MDIRFKREKKFNYLINTYITDQDSGMLMSAGLIVGHNIMLVPNNTVALKLSFFLSFFSFCFLVSLVLIYPLGTIGVRIHGVSSFHWRSS